jgi:sarcosine oxidase delta subunit
MKRRLFIKQVSIVSTGILAFSGTKIHANNTEEKSTVIDLLPFANVSKKITLKGAILDATTFEPIENCKMTVKAKRNRIFNTTKDILTSNGDYSIISGFTSTGKTHEKIEVEIKAMGYKTYKGFVYLTTNGCNLHSEEWNYNKNFDNNHCPKNETIGSETISSFNFQLIK